MGGANHSMNIFLVGHPQFWPLVLNMQRTDPTAANIWSVPHFRPGPISISQKMTKVSIRNLLDVLVFSLPRPTNVWFLPTSPNPWIKNKQAHTKGNRVEIHINCYTVDCKSSWPYGPRDKLLEEQPARPTIGWMVDPDHWYDGSLHEGRFPWNSWRLESFQPFSKAS